MGASVSHECFVFRVATTASAAASLVTKDAERKPNTTTEKAIVCLLRACLSLVCSQDVGRPDLQPTSLWSAIIVSTIKTAEDRGWHTPGAENDYSA